MTSLRAVHSQKTHHFTTFRTGIALGLAVPAFVDGLVRSTFLSFLSSSCYLDALGFQHPTRAAIPAWASLLYIYAIFFVPTVFAFLVGTNLLVWSASRINYVFIFGKCPAVFLLISDKLIIQSLMLERVSITVNTSRWVTGYASGVRMLTSTHCRYLAFY